MPSWKIAAAVTLLAIPLIGQPYREMDYGPFLTMTVEVGPGNIAQKAVCFRLDAGEGGVSNGKAFVAFETDTLRYASAWTGGFIDWRGIIFDGSHNSHPKTAGNTVFTNPVGPGWGRPEDGSFDDPRTLGLDGKPYGPLPRAWGRFSGIRRGKAGTIEYEVGGTVVRESPSLAPGRDDVFVRGITTGPHATPRVMQVAHQRGAKPTLLDLTTLKATTDGAAANTLVIVPVDDVTIPTNDQLVLGATDYTISAWIKTRTPTGTIFSKAAPEGEWVPKGKTLFVRDGRLGFDVGWVGAVESRKRITDGKWHHVAMTHRGKDGLITLFVDGKEDGDGELPSPDGPGHVVRLGYTATTFMPPFKGAIDEVSVYRRRLSSDDIAKLSRGEGVDRAEARWSFDQLEGGKAANAVDAGLIAHLDGARGGRGRIGRGLVFDGRGQVRIGDRYKEDRPAPERDDGDQTVLAFAVRGNGVGDWAPDGEDIRLRIASSTEARGFDVLHWRGKRRDLATFAAMARAPRVPGRSFPDSARQGTVTTRARRVHDTGPFAIDAITLPTDNPWDSYIRLGGFDFFDGGDKAAVASWQGDVWTVEGLSKLDSGDAQLTWRCIATGLFQPLGLKIKDGAIYVLGRDQITRLVDENGDGWTDWYENFNNDAEVTEHFHEFAMDLQTDGNGDFYYMKGARHAKTAVVSQHGTLVKVSADGTTSEVIASGYRAPNGLCVNPDGTFFTSDQEGHWTPMNRINHVVKGGFYGNMMGYCPEREDETTDPPLCWIHKDTDRSPAAQLWARSDRWKELDGALLSLSYGTGRIWNVLHEEVGGVKQGGIVQLPLPEFPTGIQRGRFHEQDGQLYVCGLFGWSSNKNSPGGFFRVSRTEAPLDLPTSLNVVDGGVVIGFSSPLDREAAIDPRRYRVQRWNYKRTRNYGSRDWKISDGKQGRDDVPVIAVKLSRDGKSVFLRMPDMGPCMQMEIQYTLRAARGTDVRGKVHHTIHGLGPAAAVADRFEGGLAVSDVAVARVTQKPGLVLTTTSRIAGRTDETSQVVARMAALRVEAGRHASPFVTAGAFDAVFEGFIDVDVPGRYRFHADASGPLTVRVGDRTVLDGRGASSRISGDSVELLAGPTPIRIALRSNDEGALAFRLLWSGEGFAAEPVPPRVLRHQPGPTLVKHIALDEGRTLFATLSCAKCHEVPGGHATTGPSAMPELNDPTPALDAVGSRFTAPWMFAWMLDPHRLQRDPRMPDLFPGRDRDARRDAADIAAWLAGQTKEAEPILPESKGATAGQGRELFENLGCVACHDFERPDRADESRRHTLHFAAAKFKPGALSAYLEQPAAHHAATRMPEFGLSRGEAEALARYIRQRSRGKVSKLPDGADAARGRDAFIGRGCASCHQVAEQSITRPSHAPALDFGERTSDGCVADRPRSRAADFRLDAAQRDALRAFIAGEHGDSLQRVAAHQAAERAVVAAACTSCHDRDGFPSSRMELLVAEGRPDATLEVLPDLTWTGEKLRVPWTESLLMGKLDHRARPWMKAKMPAFPSRAAVIARGLPHAHGVSQSDTSRPAVDAASARTGARVAMGEGSLACNQCHGVGALEAFGPFGDRGVNFAHVADRLRHDFYLRWMHAPERITPGTKMPTFAGAGGKTAATSIADGDASAQFAALWQWLETRPRSSRAFVRKWALSDLAPKIAQLERGRSFATGKALFSSMSCVQCHQIGGKGGTIGPDLSKIADKHAPLALLQEVLAPSKVIEDRYRVHTVFTKDDDIVDGMLLGEDARTLRILTNPLDPKSAVTVKKAEIDERRISATSPMPTDLLNTLKEAEVFDLLAYVLAGGDASHPAFRDR